MGMPEISVFGTDPLFTTLASEGVVSGQFGVKLADNGSELFLGGVDSGLVGGAFTNVPVTQDVSAVSISSRGRAMAHCTAFRDSGR